MIHPEAEQEKPEQTRALRDGGLPARCSRHHSRLYRHFPLVKPSLSPHVPQFHAERGHGRTTAGSRPRGLGYPQSEPCREYDTRFQAAEGRIMGTAGLPGPEEGHARDQLTDALDYGPELVHQPADARARPSH